MEKTSSGKKKNQLLRIINNKEHINKVPESRLNRYKTKIMKENKKG
jgi:hypothetical protein